ncbi:MAG TPA: hypothetical protein VK716_07825 [Terracidiphilus sp.]|jgi:hypothetical protein|nr:hypothetical protein [Terracidiphilus sp.]
MANLALHFDIAPGADASVLADQLQSKLAKLPGVEKSNAKVLESRDPLAIASAVMTFITVAPIVMNKAADFINSIKNLINSCEGLHNAVVEIGGRRIPVNKLQPSDIEAAAAPHP